MLTRSAAAGNLINQIFVKMANSNEKTLEQQFTDIAVGSITFSTSVAPILAVLATWGISIASGYIEYLYQRPAFGETAIYIALMAAGVRVFFGMTGIDLMRKRHYPAGLFFMAAALAITLYLWYHSKLVAETINPEYIAQIQTVFTVLLFGGYAGEIGMAIYMATAGKSGKGFGAINLSWIANMVKKETNGVP